jgi:hypothetical protein
VANFLKGYLGIWLRMTLIIGFGVMFSTFLSGPIALLATLGIMIGGWQSDFVGRLARGETFGGGPTESLWRLFTQQNVVSELPEGLHANVVRAIDTGARKVLQLIWHSLPDFAQLNFSDEVASGFDISGDLVLMSLCRAAMFLVPLIALAYLFLKTRELAQ